MSTIVEQAATAATASEAAPAASVVSSTPTASASATATATSTAVALSGAPTAATTEIEQLQQALIEKQSQLYALESACLRETERQVELEDSVIAWQDKYDRLYESHKRVQKVNQSLEDKMLKLVDRNANERAQLTSDVATLSVRLAQANFNIAKLQREIERYKADISLAIQLLQCKPDSFVAQKVSSLPIDIQAKVSAYMRLETNSHSDSECSNSGVGVATTASYKVLPASDSPPPAACPFPPTAMVYSMRGLDETNGNGNNPPQQTTTNGNSNNQNNNNNATKDTLNNNNISNNNSNNNPHKFNNNSSGNGNHTTSHSISNPNSDMISPTIMAKFLEDELKANEVKHCDTCACSKQDLQVLADVSRSYTVATQTPHHQQSLQLQQGGASTLNEPLTQLCLRCHSNLNSPSRTNSPYLMKLVKSSDSVISETKSSVSDLNDMDKLFVPAKKDDLMVNPILGHHRLCERTSAVTASTLMYPTTHLGAYAAEKYLLETSNLGQLRNGYHRRFLDGGGTALQLLTKFEGGASAAAAQEELEDESSKPLLSGISQGNLLETEQQPLPQVPPVQASKLEDVCEPLPLKTVPVAAAGGAPAAAAAAHLKSTNSGSVQSLWSNKTSSCEGARMFETFNRNLIKTIKAENPKYRGPRLCAMRIQQNGQSNILLDNLESIEAYKPVIYKRRERLLDEELNDGKDIITSKDSNAASAVEAWQGPAAPHEHVVLQPVLEPLVEPQQETEQEESSQPAAGEAAAAAAAGVSSGVAVHSPKHSANSSSMSDAIDYQESVLLRRQQLSRVAEWVQHNTQQLEQRNLQQPPLPSDSTAGTERQSSYSTLDRMDSISIEKLSMDSGYKTTPQQLTNGPTEDSLSPKTDITSNSLPEAASAPTMAKKTELCTTYYRRTTRSGLPVAYTTTAAAAAAAAAAASGTPPGGDSLSSGSSAPLMCPEQPTCDILNYKYYPNDTDKTRSVQAELHTTTQHVDIAQMEYNVKQFLLKQNEWSMRGDGATQGGGNVVAMPGGARLVRHTRLMGPGVGERVRMATPGGAVAAQTGAMAPHRTETNL
ncbi:uncharacterized protein LOC117893684 isoform X2 [Drosophila subobscura]|uniref:uncharacterized protein LOC117893684 isoform X2 n=1 Tax=Drosophila subobscura TaxID=7241 RepID=UPI00155ACF6D|nr:uncharacterized protein LOC117893684 isoform X2 [Drosophila subobscura]